MEKFTNGDQDIAQLMVKFAEIVEKKITLQRSVKVHIAERSIIQVSMLVSVTIRQVWKLLSGIIHGKQKENLRFIHVVRIQQQEKLWIA